MSMTVSGSGALRGPRPNAVVLQYAAAVALPILTLLARLALWPFISGLPFVAFIPSVALVTALAGTGPAVLAATLSAVLGLAFLSVPSPFGPGSGGIWIGLATYVMVCAILIAFRLQSARDTALRVKAEAERSADREAALLARLSVAEEAAARGDVERRLETLIDALPVLVSHVTRDLRYGFVNRAYEEWFGRARGDLKGRRLGEVLWPEVMTRVQPFIDAALAGQAVTFDERIPHRDGSLRDVQAHYVPNLRADGVVDGYFALVQDVTGARRQTELLGQRERHMRAVLESVTDCFYALDADWRITLLNRSAELYMGRSRDELLGRVLWEEFPRLVGTETERQLRRAMAERVPVTFEAPAALDPGRFKEFRISPKDESGLAVSFSDITGRKAAERQREILVNELNHRVKNTLAVVQSIAAKTFADPGVPALCRDAFEGRLMALAAAHDLLTLENWEAARLEGLIRSVLRPFAVDHRVILSGPDLRIRPQAAVSLTLALHELATNAVKYGALSNAAGSVSLRWTVTTEDAMRFHLTWEEAGGPAVHPPSRAGFGSRLIRQGLAGELLGSVVLDYRPAGLVCAVDAPLAQVEAR